VFGFGKSKENLSGEAVLEALKRVRDPELDRDLIELDAVQNLKVSGTKVSFTLTLATPAHPAKAAIESMCREVLQELGASKITLQVEARVKPAASGKQEIPGVANLLAVASGKGGVGKSTVSLNLALALRDRGARVGFLDCDIYGPSLPSMTGVFGKPKSMPDNTIVPHQIFEMPMMSMGFLLEPGQAANWRGPMLHKIIQQFLFRVAWPELDYLVLDLPPGTGDVQLSLTQSAPLAGGVVVTTPQDAALEDARKGIEMFRQVHVPVLGLVENMAEYTCRKCGKVHHIFQQGGGEKMAKEYDVPVLTRLPLDPALAHGHGEGRPLLARAKKEPAAARFLDLADQVGITLAKMEPRKDREHREGWHTPDAGAMEV
jgi:ATP-binding protein involved in chromosome partitioning